MEATLTFLGSGTSMGIPTLGCDCAVCTSAVSPTGDPRNRRTRPSIRLAYNHHTVLIDTGPDFHAQAIRERIHRVDAVPPPPAHPPPSRAFDPPPPLTSPLQATPPISPAAPPPPATEPFFHSPFPADSKNRYHTSARVQIH